MRPYSVSERLIDSTWCYVVVDQRSQDVTEPADNRAQARRWCDWLNDAYECGWLAGGSHILKAHAMLYEDGDGIREVSQ